MYEADELCERIAVIADGAFVAHGTPRRVKERVPSRTVIEIETFGVAEPTRSSGCARSPGVRAVAVETRDQARCCIVQSRSGAELCMQLLCASSTGRSVGRVVAREPTLEDAYVALVTRGMRRAPARGMAGSCTSRCCRSSRSTACSV